MSLFDSSVLFTNFLDTTVKQITEFYHFRGRRSLQDDLLLDQIDDLDDLNSFFIVFGESSDVDRYNRDNALIAIRQICAGYKNWAKRYLGKCSGQRVHQHQVNLKANKS